MDEFVNSLNTNIFESTNALWNNLMLNDPWSVSYVTTLIELEHFKRKEDWEAYYYSSGVQRNKKVISLSTELQTKLNDEQLVQKNKDVILKMGWDLRNLNYNYGRTQNQLARKGEILFQHASANGIKITENECIEAVRFRTICQTWNGIKIREKNTIKVLQHKFPFVDFISTKGDFDYSFAVDYELKIADKLICGIQIKPKSYMGNAPYLRKAQNANLRKNQAYEHQFGKPVFNILSKLNGEVINVEVLITISNLIIK